MFPHRDDNPTRGPAVVTVAVVAVNVLVWIFGEGMGAESTLSQAVCRFGLVTSRAGAVALGVSPGHCGGNAEADPRPASPAAGGTPA